jgi:hypothetical protein
VFTELLPLLRQPDESISPSRLGVKAALDKIQPEASELYYWPRSRRSADFSPQTHALSERNSFLSSRVASSYAFNLRHCSTALVSEIGATQEDARTRILTEQH